jgi:hypothetical protein
MGKKALIAILIGGGVVAAIAYKKGVFDKAKRVRRHIN